MEAATLEQSSGETSPVFVTGGRHRSHAVRLAAAALGLLLAGWLTALVAGLVGFSPLPELTFPGTGAARTPAVVPAQAPKPAAARDAGAQASPIASHAARGGGQPNDGGASSAPGASGASAGVAGGQAPGGGTGSTSPDSGGNAPQAPAPSGGAASPSSSGHPPSFTPPASGEKSASPPRGNSADAPGSAVSADPPGGAARPHSG